MGFGHRVYKNFDPRARIIKQKADELLGKLGIHDPLLELAKKLEDAALKDDYFVSRKLYPNVDFLQRYYFTCYRYSFKYVSGNVCYRTYARLDCALERNDPRSDDKDWPSLPSVC